MANVANELVDQGEKLFLAHQFKASALCFSKARELERQAGGDPYRATLGLARVHVVEGSADEATKLLDALTAAHPERGEPLMYRGVLDERRGDLKGALERYEEAVRKAPGSGLARYNLGRALGQLRRWTEATRELRAAVEAEPSNPGFLFALATALQASGRTADALVVLVQCVGQAPDYLDGYVTLADLLVFVGQEDVADQLLAAAEARFPEAGVLLSKRAAICARRNDVPGVIRHLERQVEIDARNPEAWLNLAVYRLMVFQFEGAEDALQKALAIDPRSGRAHYQLGVLYDACRLSDLARAEFQKAIECAPGFWRPYNNLGTLLLEQSSQADTAAAVKLFEQARARASGVDRIPPTYNLALAYWKQGRKPESERCAREAAAGPPGNPVAEDARRFLANF